MGSAEPSLCHVMQHSDLNDFKHHVEVYLRHPAPELYETLAIILISPWIIPGSILCPFSFHFTSVDGNYFAVFYIRMFRAFSWLAFRAQGLCRVPALWFSV